MAQEFGVNGDLFLQELCHKIKDDTKKINEIYEFFELYSDVVSGLLTLENDHKRVSWGREFWAC